MTTGSDRLKSAVSRWRMAQTGGVDQAPGCVFGLMTRDGVDDLRDEMGRLRVSIDNTNKLLIGLLVSIVLSIVGLALRGVFG